jgi:hypothetical protein
MSVDFRTRRDEETKPLDSDAFFSSVFPEALEANRALIRPGVSGLKLHPLSVETEGKTWTLRWQGDRVLVEAGPADGARQIRLSGEALSDLVSDQSTPMTLFTSGTLDMPKGGLADLLDWWLVLRSALDARPLHTPGAVTFFDRNGAPLDLRRSFRPDDDPEEMSHFLHEAGFLHLTGVFSEAVMAEISADMDRAAGSYCDGDGRSWWASVAGGERRLVRMQSFDTHSAAAKDLLEDERFLRIGAVSGDGHVHAGLTGNRVEALVKPLGVIEGISDLPWHKDCSLGRHSYECCSMTTGISVTGADAVSGQLGVVAGSHRALLWPALHRPGNHDLPEIELPTRTGDVTVHLSCTLHMSQAPVQRERRVMYTSFRLPAAPSEARKRALARISAVREAAPTTVSQQPAGGVPRKR